MIIKTWNYRKIWTLFRGFFLLSLLFPTEFHRCITLRACMWLSNQLERLFPGNHHKNKFITAYFRFSIMDFLTFYLNASAVYGLIQQSIKSHNTLSDRKCSFALDLTHPISTATLKVVAEKFSNFSESEKPVIEVTVLGALT